MTYNILYLANCFCKHQTIDTLSTRLMSKSLSYFKAVILCMVHFALRILFHFCVKKLLHLALKSCHILRQKLLHFGLMLHFASKVVIFLVAVTFSVNCYILRRNRLHSSETFRLVILLYFLHLRFQDLLFVV